MKAKLFIGAAALIGVLGVSTQAAAETCSDFLNRGRVVRASLQNREITQNDANDQIRRIQAEATASGLCDLRNLDALGRLRGIIEAYGSTPEGASGVTTQTSTSSQATAVSPPVPVQPARVQTLALSQPVISELTSGSPVDPATDVAYEMWTFRADAGQPLQISMSEARDSFLDTYVAVGRVQNGQFVEIDHNDDSRGTLNSLLRFEAPTSGEYAIRARSYAPGQYGAYELVIEPVPPLVPPRITPLTINQAASGQLTADTAVDEERGVAHDIWTFHAEQGERLRISMSASEGSSLDTYLMLGQLVDGQFYPFAYNDDRGDGTFNSMLRFRPSETGDYAIRATAYAQNQFGGYDLVVERVPFTADSPAPIASSQNAWVQAGELSPGADHIDFQFQPARAGRYRVQVVSDEFMPMVEVGAVQPRTDALTELTPFDPDAARHDVAQFDGERRGRYVVRVSSTTASGGGFSVIVAPIQ